MQVQEVREDAYFNFVNSINSDVIRRNYEYCMSRFLKYCNLYPEFLSLITTARNIPAIIEAKKSVVMSDMGLLAAQYEIQYSIAKINL